MNTEEAALKTRTYSEDDFRQYHSEVLDLLKERKSSFYVKVDEESKTFEGIYVVDMTYKHYVWQSTEHSFHQHPIEKDRLKRIHVKKYPRRHGKTYYEVNDQVDYLVSLERKSAIGAFYCVDREQSVRNTWAMFAEKLNKLPGTHMDRNTGQITIKRPLLGIPNNKITIYFFGIRGGSGKKRGGYYDHVVMDEIEYIPPDFVEEVAIISTVDRKGHVRLLGTPAKIGGTEYWLDKAKSKYAISQAVLSGKKAMTKEHLDCHEWSFREANAYDLKVYPKDYLDMQRAMLSEVVFNQEFMCIDTHMQSGYYHRDALDEAQKRGFVSPDINFDPALPLRVYFDLGIGTKSNKMAFAVCQFTTGGIVFLHGQDVMGKGYVQACMALRNSPYGRGPTPFFEVVLPHDARSSEQSDAVPKEYKFEQALVSQGINANLRVMPQTSDMLMDTDLVTQYLRSNKIKIDSVGASSVVDALRCHRRKWSKQTEMWEGEPSRTKWRDMADVVRHACVDYESDNYLRTENEMLSPGKVDGTQREWVGVGFHPTRNSICLGNDGELLPIGVNPREQDGIFFKSDF